MNQKTINTLVVAESVLERQDIVDALRSLPRASVSDSVTNLRIALMKLERKRPDVIILRPAGGEDWSALSSWLSENDCTLFLLADPEAASLPVEITRLAVLIGFNNGFAAALREGWEQIGRRAVPPVSKLTGGKTRLILIGASAGGTEAVSYLLENLKKKDFPPIVIAQHMPEQFTGIFAKRLEQSVNFPVTEIQEGVKLEKGRVYILRGGRNMALRRKQGEYFSEYSELNDRKQASPSIDHLFLSALGSAPEILAIILTGMGHDGAAGLLELKKAGARTVAQDEKSSTIYGMPKSARDLGAAEEILSLSAIGDLLNRMEMK